MGYFLLFNTILDNYIDGDALISLNGAPFRPCEKDSQATPSKFIKIGFNV